MAVERCRFYWWIFSSARAANVHEARCKLRGGVRSALSCRKCGMLFARHFSRGFRRNHEQYCLGSSVSNLMCRSCGMFFLHMQARRLHERYCAGICPDMSVLVLPCGFEVHVPLGASKRDRDTATHKKYVHHKNSRRGGDAQITFPRCGRTFPSARARAVHEPSCRSCRWRDLMFRTGGGRLHPK